ncbi:hypothetical protein AAFF_G00306410 [Aldrovandia affinis]|uniref:Uncharacterized protein n=1 Tax=Aldrovandia affinis TaxID=143900 RepID=A0AAD7WRJ7_9TELE|nr:hypothetical protein AAFF_G00306410 [Aldrovandia affinis]
MCPHDMQRCNRPQHNRQNIAWILGPSPDICHGNISKRQFDNNVMLGERSGGLTRGLSLNRVRIHHLNGQQIRRDVTCLQWDICSSDKHSAAAEMDSLVLGARRPARVKRLGASRVRAEP